MAERTTNSGNGRGNGASNGRQGDGAQMSSLASYVPPQSIEAEQSTLGAMLIEPAAIEKAAEILDVEDFYRQSHQIIFDVICSINQRDEPVDLITVQEELKNRDKMEAIGGLSYLTGLFDAVPTAANIEYYAKIVEEKAVLRRLIAGALEIIGMARGEIENIDELIDKAEQIVFSVSRQRGDSYFAQLRTLLLNVFDKIEELGESKSQISGLPTGIHDFDMITSGLQNTDLIIVAARPSMGKCLRSDTLIDNPETGERLTIEQWVKQELPTVFGVSDSGKVRTAQISAWVDSGVKPCYRVRTCTGRSVEVTGHHPFLTVHGWTPLHDLSVGSKIAVPRQVPAFGTDEISPANFLSIVDKLTEEKSFPDCVWRWSRSHLAALLQVILSSDSTSCSMQGTPRIEFAADSERLVQDVHHALTRFGIVSNLRCKSPQCWSVEIIEPASVALYQNEIGWIGEKSDRFSADFAQWQNENDTILAHNSHSDLYWDEIVAIEPTGEHQVYDLSVPDGANFIAQDVCVHNTSFCLSIAEHVAIKEKKAVAIFSLEMSKEQLALRMLCSQAEVNAHKLRTGHLSEEEWTELAMVVQSMYEAPIFIDDATETTALTMRAKCRRLMAEHGLGLIIVDYLQLMRSHRKTDNRTQEIGEIARGLKSLGRELKVPVIALSQLSRAVEQRENKRPMLSDLRESGSIEAEADMVCFLYREAYYKLKEAYNSEEGERPQREEQEETEIIVGKHRNGPTGMVKVGFKPSYAKFVNLANRDDEPTGF